MKLKINRGLRMGLIGILILVLAALSFFLYREVKVPVFKEENQTIYSYKNKANIDYKVFLKENNLYTTSSPEAGKPYMTEFVDYINTKFSYKFTGQGQADLKGYYDIGARIRGFTGGGEELVTIWERDFPIISRKKFTIKNNQASINEEVSLRLEEYNKFAQDIIEVSKVNCDSDLIIEMEVSLEGDSDNKSISDRVATDLIIPLNVSMFEIAGETDINKPGSLEETIRVQEPVSKKRVIVYSILAVVTLAGLIYLIFFTEELPPLDDPVEKELRKIFKKHGERLVALRKEVSWEGASIIELKSMDDLVKVADELSRPIIYQDEENIKKFYLTNENELYVLDLQEALIGKRTGQAKLRTKLLKVEKSQ